MKKIKKVFVYIGQLIVNPIKKLASFPITDKFIEFVNKHVWLRFLVALLITTAGFLYYYLKIKGR